MKKTVYILFLSICCCLSRAQVPADSLLGVYAGLNYEKNSDVSNWTITPDTITIKIIDSVSCQVQLYTTTCCWSEGWYASFYTTYSSLCPVDSNSFFKFYPFDSLSAIANNIPQSPPNYPLSYHFYGKRIGPYHSTSIEQLRMQNDELRIYPNPSNSILNVQSTGYSVQCTLYDVLGNEVVSTTEKEIDISSLANGVYLLKVKTNEGISQKIIIQH